MKTVNDVRNDSVNIQRSVNGLTAVIVKTFYSKSKFNLGVQFWNESEISVGVCGGSKLIEVL